MRVSGVIFFIGLTVMLPISGNALDSPENLAGLAVKANPEVSMLRHQIEALQEQEKASVVWNDPVFMLEYGNVPWENPYLDEHPMSGVQFRLQQTFPFPGKNDRRQAVAGAQVDLKRLELEELKNQLTGKVKQFYWMLSLIRKRTEIKDKHIRIVESLFEAVEAMYASGSANQQDVLKLQVLKDKLTDEIQDLEQQRRELTGMINSALHRNVDDPVEVHADIPLITCTATLDELVQVAEKERVLLRFWKRKAEVERLAAERELYEGRPDITLWTGYRLRQEVGTDKGDDFLSVGMSVPIPFDFKDRYDAKSRAHLADALASEEKYDLVLDEISSSLEKSLSKWERSCEKVRTYTEKLIPQAEATLEAALSAWQVGRTEFSSLYQAEVQLLSFEETVIDARAQTVLMSLEVERLVGESPTTEAEEMS